MENIKSPDNNSLAPNNNPNPYQLPGYRPLNKRNGSSKIPGRVYYRVMDGFNYYGDYVFITLTSRLLLSINNTPRLKYDWARMRKRIARKYGNIDYIWVIGAGEKKGMFHIHVIIRFRKHVELNSLKKWLADNWFKLHNSFIIHVKPIEKKMYKDRADYMAKNIAHKRYCWNKSRGWLKKGWRNDRKCIIKSFDYDFFKSSEGQQLYRTMLLELPSKLPSDPSFVNSSIIESSLQIENKGENK